MTSPYVEGVLRVDKPPGPTSHDVVASVRRALGVRRAGHTGTLDPFASGLLLLCLGASTRLAEYLTGLAKTYEATARLGVSTDSGDRDGEVLFRSDAWESLTQERVADAMGRLRGELDQLPPALSARKVRGVPAHRRVRRGEEVVLTPRRVTVFTLEVVSFVPPDLTFLVACSTGTYVRALARDLGDILGVGAHLTALRRTAIGPFSVDGALPPSALDGGDDVRAWIIPPAEAVRHLARVEVDEEGAGLLAHGRSIDTPDFPAGPAAAVHGSGLVAMGEIRGGRFNPRKVFRHA